jgi:hypothetical protein
MQALAKEVDARDLWSAMERDRLTALVGTRLEAVGALPAELVDPVRQRLMGNRLRALHFGAVGRQVTESLEAKAIPALPLKGFALAEDVHDDPGLRLYGDIDLLIPKPALRAASDALRPLGYEPYDRPGEEILPDLHLEVVDSAGLQPMVELHWRIHWVEDAFATTMLERSTMHQGRRCADPVDQLAALLLFFARDGFVGLRLAADIAAWYDIHGQSVSRRGLDTLACGYPGLRSLWWTALTVAQGFVGVPAAELMTPLRPATRRRLARRMSNPTSAGDGDQVAAEVTLVNLLLSPLTDLPAMVRRHVFLTRWRVEDYYSVPPEAAMRRRLWQVVHSAKVVARQIRALVTAPWR